MRRRRNAGVVARSDGRVATRGGVRQGNNTRIQDGDGVAVQHGVRTVNVVVRKCEQVPELAGVASYGRAIGILCSLKGGVLAGWNRGTNVAKVAAAFVHGRNCLIELGRRFFQTVLFGKEEEGLIFLDVVAVGNIQRASNGSTQVGAAIERRTPGLIEEIPGIQRFIASEVVAISMKVLGPG